jgi:hypothetical protein
MLLTYAPAISAHLIILTCVQGAGYNLQVSKYYCKAWLKSVTEETNIGMKNKDTLYEAV